MPSPLSIDLRTRAVGAYEAGEGSQEEVAKRFAISPSTLFRWLMRKWATSSLAPDKSGGSKPLIGPDEEVVIRAALEEKRDATLAELCEHLRKQASVSVSVTNMSRALARMGITKKNASRHGT
jgi:transposase